MNSVRVATAPTPNTPSAPPATAPSSTGAARRALLVFAALAVPAILLGAMETDFGRFSNSFHVDGAHHLAITETIYQGADPASREVFLVLNQYPNLAHRGVALLAKALNIDPLRSMALVSGILIYLACLAYGARFAGVLARRDRQPRVVTPLLAVAGLLTSAHYGIGNVVHHYEWNYFFPQLASVLLAMVLLLALQALPTAAARLPLLVVGFWVLASVHLIGAAWFSLAALFVLLGSETTWRRRLLVPGAGGAALLAVALLDDDVLAMVRIAEGNGGVLFLNEGWCEGTLCNLTDAFSLVIWLYVGSILLLLLAAALWWLQEGAASPRQISVDHAGLLAIVTLFGLQLLALLLLGTGSRYGLAKLTFVLIPEALLLLASIGSRPRPHTAESRRDMPLVLAAVVVTVVFAAAQRPQLFEAPYDQRALFEQRQTVLRYLAERSPGGPREYPQFNAPSWANYYLAIGVMMMPTDDRTMQWYLQGDARTERPIPASASG